MTWISLAAPVDQGTLRTLSASVGVLFTAMAGIVSSYVLTRHSSTQEVRARYEEYLSGVAMGIAHVYSVLNTVTELRRSGGYQHEETYQEVIIQSGEELLTQFDSIARVCGPTSTSLASSKQEMDGLKSLYARPSLGAAEALSALQSRQGQAMDALTEVRCPGCAKRLNAPLKARVGWTSRVRCDRCGTQFSIHRRADMSVYVGAGSVHTPSLAQQAGAGSDGDESEARDPGAGSVAESQSLTAPGAAESERLSFTVRCPTCDWEIRCAPGNPDATSIVRTCLNCKLFVYIDVRSRAVGSTFPANYVDNAAIIGRDRTYPQVACPGDGYTLSATFRNPSDPRRYAVCPSHRAIVGVDRGHFREWLASHDPEYLVTRVSAEEAGDAVRLITDAVD